MARVIAPFAACSAFVVAVVTGMAVLDGSGNAGGYVVFAGLLFLLLMIYLAPSIIMYRKGDHRRGRTLLVNVLAGWLVVPWILLMAWAVRQSSRRSEP